MTNSILIPVFNGTIQQSPIQLCNARELHAFVESKQQYGDWIKNRITDYGFIQDEDYIIVTERTNGRPRKEYHITLDMGKELAMVERNEKGRQVRKYFIECEKRGKAYERQQQPALPEPEPQITLKLTQSEYDALKVIITNYCPNVEKLAQRIEEYQRKLYQSLGVNPYQNNPIAANAYSLVAEYRYFIRKANTIFTQF